MAPATNFGEYAQQRFCAMAPYMAGAAGAYAIVTGTTLPLSAIPTIALVAAVQGCGLSPAPNNTMYPYVSPYIQGKCPGVQYTIYVLSNGVEQPALGISGPFDNRGLQTNGLNYWWEIAKGSNVWTLGGYRPDLGESPTTIRIARNDGQPDNCAGGGIVQPTTPNPYPVPTTINNNYYAPEVTIEVRISPTLVVPVVAPPLLIPMPYPLPLIIPTPFGPTAVKPDGSIVQCDPCCVNPLDYFPPIDQCPECEELISVALAIGTCVEGEGGITTKTVRVVAGDLVDDDLDAIASGAYAVASSCGAGGEPEQKPKTLIGTGSATNSVQLFYVAVEPDVQSVLLVITGSSAVSELRGTAFQSAGQKAYGAIGFSHADESDGGGHEQQVYSKRHYYRLPMGKKGGKVKVLLKPGTTWQLFDTGER